MLLENIKVVYDKNRLDLNFLKKEKILKNMFVTSFSKMHSITYFKCNKVEHKVFDCHFTKKLEIFLLSKFEFQKEPSILIQKGPR